MTPINSDLQSKILNEWHEWCVAVSSDTIDDYYTSHSNSKIIENAIVKSKFKRHYRKKAVFNGRYGVGYIPIDYTVEWI